MVRCVEGWFHEGRNRVHRFLCSHDGDLKGLCHGDDFCVVARRKQLQTFGKVLASPFEVKQTGHIGFSASDQKELKILNRTTKIDVPNDEMTLEADTKLVEGSLESMMLTGAKGVDSPRVRRNKEHTAQIENSEKLTSAESTLYCSFLMKLACVAQATEWTHARTQEVRSIPGEEQEMRVDVCTTNVRCNVAGACGL